MSVTDSAIREARGWSEHLLGKAFRGPGDTIERAAYQVEQTYGVPASILQRLRHREVRDMLLSNWLVLKHAYDAACEDIERRADHQKFIAEKTGTNAADSRAFAAASLLDRREDDIEED
jgi:hypothetical protein